MTFLLKSTYTSSKDSLSMEFTGNQTLSAEIPAARKFAFVILLIYSSLSCIFPSPLPPSSSVFRHK